MPGHTRRHIGKWSALGIYWIVQALVVFVIATLWLSQGVTVDAKTPTGRIDIDEILDIFVDPEYVFYFTITIVVVSVLQGLFLLPVRRPSAAAARGSSLWLSLAIAAALITLLAWAGAMAVLAAAWLLLGDDVYEGSGGTILLVVMGVSWLVFTLLLIRFCRAQPRETLLSRLASRLFLGTIIETAAIIPLDVMVRRKTDCYCFQGTFIALSICGAVGLFIAGPAVFLPILAKRRRRWHDGRCEVCAYDMTGCIGAERCPECGTGWRKVKDRPSAESQG